MIKMKISEFIKAILPRMEKDKLAEDLRITIDELDKIAIPSYQAANAFFKTYKFQSEEVEAMSLTFKRNYESKHPRQSNFISDINLALANLRANAETILDQAEAVLNEDIVTEGLTAKKALIIRSAEMLSFVTRYSIDLLNLVYESESKAVGAPESYEAIKLPPIRRETTLKNVNRFAMLLADYSMDTKRFSTALSDVPEIFVNVKNAASIASIYKEKDIDPFAGSYMAGFSGSPIYHVRLIFTEWQANRYKSNKEKKVVLELRLLYLKSLKDKGSNASLEREIEHTQDRVNKIERYLNSVETDLGI